VAEFRQAHSLVADGGVEVDTWERLDAEARSSGYGDDPGDEQIDESGQLSEDGRWRWDGTDWLPVDDGGTGASPSGTDDHPVGGQADGSGQLSEDGQWRWDGTDWQPNNSIGIVGAANSTGARPAWGVDGDEEQLSVLDGRFEWRVVNQEPRDGSPGGWKEAESYVRFRTFSTVPRDIRIGFRVGVPIVSHEGFISDEFATSSAVMASQVAGRGLLLWLRANDPLGVAPESMIEANFIRLMGEAMDERIKGSRVTRVTIPTRR